jgi:hypothetical protein
MYGSPTGFSLYLAAQHADDLRRDAAAARQARAARAARRGRRGRGRAASRAMRPAPAS